MTSRVPDPMLALARGLAVFALPPGGRACSPGWQARATLDLDEVRRTWKPGDNIGIGCRASGVVGIDLDRHDGKPDGIATFTALCDRLGHPWPDTLTVSTPNRGLHLYFTVPAGRIVGSTSGGRSRLGPGIDTRGPGRRSGGYLIGPDSIVGGRRYLIERDVPTAELPGWITDLLQLPATAPDPKGTTTS